MKIIKTRFVDIPICLFKVTYGINIDDALDLCHERGKIISPVLLELSKVSSGEGSLKVEQPKKICLVAISNMFIKNDLTVSFKEEFIEVR